MKRCVLLLTLTLGVTGVACAKVGPYGLGGPVWDIEISPEQPTSMDIVYVTVSRVVGGARHLEITDVTIEGDEIWVSAVVHEPGPNEGAICVDHWVDDTEWLGALTPGTYTVYVGDGTPGSYHASLSFTVAQPRSIAALESRLGEWHGQAPTVDCMCQRWPALFVDRPCPFCGRDPGDSSETQGYCYDYDSPFGVLLQRIAAVRQN